MKIYNTTTKMIEEVLLASHEDGQEDELSQIVANLDYLGGDIAAGDEIVDPTDRSNYTSFSATAETIEWLRNYVANLDRIDELKEELSELGVSDEEIYEIEQEYQGADTEDAATYTIEALEKLLDERGEEEDEDEEGKIINAIAEVASYAEGHFKKPVFVFGDEVYELEEAREAMEQNASDEISEKHNGDVKAWIEKYKNLCREDNR